MQIVRSKMGNHVFLYWRETVFPVFLFLVRMSFIQENRKKICERVIALEKNLDLLIFIRTGFLSVIVFFVDKN